MRFQISLLTLNLTILSLVLSGCGTKTSKTETLPPPPNFNSTIVSKSAVKEPFRARQEIKAVNPDSVRFDNNGNPVIDRGDCINSNDTNCFGQAKSIRNPDYTDKNFVNPNAAYSPNPEPYIDPFERKYEDYVEWPLNNYGYEPTVKVIVVGQSLVIKNKSGKDRWPFSPSFRAFDSGRPIKNGGQYAFKFTQPGVYGIKDKLTDLTATIYVR